MIELIAAATLAATPTQIENQIKVDKFCAYVVGIPYASDNFTDEEWERFKVCRSVIQVEPEQQLL